MRLIARVVTMILVGVPVYAQQDKPATSLERTSSAQDGTKDQQTKDDGQGKLDLPVSLDKIREALAQPPPPAELLKGLNEQPTFRLEVQERTVKAHLTAIFDRLGVRNRTQAGVVLRELELSDPARQL